MVNGGKEKQFFASKTSIISISGGKGWQFYASVFSKTMILDAKNKNRKQKPAYQNTGNSDSGCKAQELRMKNPDSETRKKKVLVSTKKWSSETEPHLLIFSGNHALLNMSLPTPQTGHTQSSGRFSKAVPGAIPLSGSPTAGSYSYPHASQTYLSM